MGAYCDPAGASPAIFPMLMQIAHNRLRVMLSEGNRIMGTTHVTVKIRTLAGKGRGYQADFLVDIGAIDCMAPASRLKAVGIKPEGRAVYEMADGRPVEMQYGFARISFVGAETVAQVVFGPEGSKSILGVVALENTRITIDPTTRTLRRLHAKPLK